MFQPPKNERKIFSEQKLIQETLKNLTTKIRKNKEQKPYFFKKILQKIFKSTKPSNKISP